MKNRMIAALLGWACVVAGPMASCSPAETRCSRKCEAWRDECGYEDFFEYSCDDGDGCPLEADCEDWSDCRADCYDCRLDLGICGDEESDEIVYDDPRCDEACACAETYSSDDVMDCLFVD
jgi:hypothetical protein